MRRLISLLCCLVGLLLVVPAQALSLADLSNKDAAAGLKEALSKGADAAVSQLGKQNGFLGDARVKIPLPDSLKRVDELARRFGLGAQADAVVETMNRAAESAVVEAKPILVNAVKAMSFADAKAILTGGDDAATQYFRQKTAAPISAKFLPIVKKATGRLQLADKYNEFAGQAAGLGLIDAKEANLDNYITQKALDGLYLMMAEKEKQIRADPIAAGSALLKKVFEAAQ